MNNGKPRINIHEGHRNRLRERFVNEGGLDSFNDHQALELLLFMCLPRCDTNAIAHELLDKFGSFSSVLDKTPEELADINGIGEKAAVSICMIKELCRRYYDDRLLPNAVLDTTEKMAEFFIPKFIGRTDECVYCVCLDNTCRVVACELAFKGSVSSAGVSVRKFAECAIKYKCSNIIIAHNHPQGLALPSSSDITATQNIVNALDSMDIRVVDHIIVAKNDCVSMFETLNWH